MEYVYQKQQRQAVVGHDGDKVVDGRDQRTRGDRGVNFDLVKQHGYQRADKAGGHHGNDERHAHAAGDKKRRALGVALAQMDIHAQKHQRHNAEAAAV